MPWMISFIIPSTGKILVSWLLEPDFRDCSCLPSYIHQMLLSWSRMGDLPTEKSVGMPRFYPPWGHIELVHSMYAAEYIICILCGPLSTKLCALLLVPCVNSCTRFSSSQVEGKPKVSAHLLKILKICPLPNSQRSNRLWWCQEKKGRQRLVGWSCCLKWL